jgi:AcrR family transcriptional regulator
LVRGLVTQKVKSAGGRPRNSELEPRDRRIMERSAELFIKNGFTATTMDAIAREAGVAKQTLYENWGDKADIFFAVVRARADALVDFEPNILENSSDLAAILNIVAHQIVDYTLRPESIALKRIIAAESTRFPDFMRSVLNESVTRLMEGVSRLFEDLAERKLIRTAAPSRDGMMFVHLIVGLHSMISVLGMPSRPSDDEIAEKIRLFVRSYRDAPG